MELERNFKQWRFYSLNKLKYKNKYAKGIIFHNNYYLQIGLKYFIKNKKKQKNFKNIIRIIKLIIKYYNKYIIKEYYNKLYLNYFRKYNQINNWNINYNKIKGLSYLIRYKKERNEMKMKLNDIIKYYNKNTYLKFIKKLKKRRKDNYYKKKEETYSNLFHSLVMLKKGMISFYNFKSHQFNHKTYLKKRNKILSFYLYEKETKLLSFPFYLLHNKTQHRKKIFRKLFNFYENKASECLLKWKSWSLKSRNIHSIYSSSRKFRLNHLKSQSFCKFKLS